MPTDSEAARRTGVQDQLLAHSRSEGARYGAMYQELIKAEVTPQHATQIVCAKVFSYELSSTAMVAVRHLAGGGKNPFRNPFGGAGDQPGDDDAPA